MKLSIDINSIGFVGFLVVALVVYYCTPKKYRYLSLLATSLISAFIISHFYALFIIFSALTIYFGGIILNKINASFLALDKVEQKTQKASYKTRKRLVLAAVILLNILILAFLKYYNPIAKAFALPTLNLLLPLGISYYTLEAISYITDVYRGKHSADNNPFRVLLFLTFFPKMTLGPIGQYHQLKDTLFAPNIVNYYELRRGAVLILYGLFKKMVIADRLGIAVDFIYQQNLSGFSYLFAMLAYAIQIYMEFSGCIDIVKGASSMFGVKVKENFTQPFFAVSIQDFWRRWHISLGDWLKEYIFYPVSISKINTKISAVIRKVFPKNFAQFIIIAIPLLFVWLVNGIWHGAGSKYILYGLYYYAVIMVGVLFAPISMKIIAKFKLDHLFLFKIFRIIRTFLLILVGFSIFRAPSFTYPFQKLLGEYQGLTIFTNNFDIKDLILVGVTLIPIFIISVLKERKIDVLTQLEKQHLIIRWFCYYLLILAIIIFGIYGEGFSPKDFIYGGF